MMLSKYFPLFALFTITYTLPMKFNVQHAEEWSLWKQVRTTEYHDLKLIFIIALLILLL